MSFTHHHHHHTYIHNYNLSSLFNKPQKVFDPFSSLFVYLWQKQSLQIFVPLHSNTFFGFLIVKEMYVYRYVPFFDFLLDVLVDFNQAEGSFRGYVLFVYLIFFFWVVATTVG